tara:strand:+ start:44 stop:1963 length:1920 start_codon:yes stop_codon:yes gene_type:complete
MASTYTLNNGLEKIGTGDQSGTWGTTTNTNFDIIDRTTNGVGAISLSGTTHALTTTDGAASDGHYKVLVFGGSISATNTITIGPNDQDKLYFIKNGTGQSIIIKQGSGATVTITTGKTAIVYADGAGAGAAVASIEPSFTDDVTMKTSDGALLTLQTSEATVVADDVLGVLQFQAPDEADGTDGIIVSAAIAAVAEDTFAADNNKTKLSFRTGASEVAAEKMALDNGGDLKILTDGASLFFGADSEIELRHVADDGLILKHVGTGDGKEPSLTFQAGDDNIAADDVLGAIYFQAPDEGSASGDNKLVAAGIEAVSEGDFSDTNNATKLSFKTAVTETATEKMTLSGAGILDVTSEINVAFSGGTTRAAIMDGSATQGAAIAGQDSGFAVANGFVLECNRTNDDGDVIIIKGQGTGEGSISVSGSTVSFNAFTGSHWSRLTDNSKPTILRGTVVETIDEMCDWYHLEFTYPEIKYKEGEKNIPNDKKVGDVRHAANTVKKPYEKPSDVNVGDTVQWTDKDDGDKVYDATVTLTKDVKHVKCKISDTADCTNVYGVFMAWDNDDDTVNDMYVNAVGTSLVRIHKDQTVAKGDLLSSNGDGTAKKQGDDIIRTKTIGKVLTNLKQETYSDGSYTVPCALYSG